MKNKMFIRTRFNYEKLPGADSQTASPLFGTPTFKSLKHRAPWVGRLQRPRLSFARILTLVVASLLIASMIGTSVYRRHRWNEDRNRPDERKLYHWEHYPRLTGFWNGVRTLVPHRDYVSEQEFIRKSTSSNPEDNIKPKWPTMSKEHKEPTVDIAPFNPYPDWNSAAYLNKHERVETCYLNEETKTELPDIYAYQGIPQNQTEPFFGSYEELGINDKVCFERYGRLGPYGYSYSREEGGLGMSEKSEAGGADKIWSWEKKVDYRDVDWGTAQKKCHEKNKIRFQKNATAAENDPTAKEKVKRHAYILRTWTGYKYSDYQILTIRAMINELALKSGGEYDVYFLLHVKDDSLPIWSSEEVYRKTIEDNLPKEFWNMAVLWSEQQMRMYYPEPFPNNVYNHAKAPVHSVYRSAHFAMQWFAQAHPDYDFYWNWEMDLRLSGHYWEFNNRIGEWAKRQPRKGIWERASRYYIPELHGSWHNFTEMVEEETYHSDEKPVWGPPKFENSGMLDTLPEVEPKTSYVQDNYEWGVGEDADLITFNPIFDPAKTNWVFRDDVSGYDLELPEPPRRCAIITVSRLSKRLLDAMHRETYLMKHHMFPEMWPSTVAFHHGLKAVYAPHAVYFDHNWPLGAIDGTFNHPPKPTDSVFGWGEHNQLGNSFYYNAGFSSELWRRWLGSRENNQGGPEAEENGTGRLCIRPTLFHPVKYEKGAE
ncbi:hypothetical protein BU24DRAFT_356225 [Aaosphaeria arxii CBS 175.79]|uniref:Uncharacterized protein n=1 Tax=Aaosphaeria arxii CBS 175.79 TaxID=1450172 RepID=A0A6A5XC95_9PLEO|nr:uncharacterized protein BU24DRAFT_356225 [Aaosphaeria arxii CBS 175.79]KAF2010540.1 hypothetical protein BU24DRAFT_356225 [Aaosphaeria arxii CBS 175.79]